MIPVFFTGALGSLLLALSWLSCEKSKSVAKKNEKIS
jgi:hypothetical protein